MESLLKDIVSSNLSHDADLIEAAPAIEQAASVILEAIQAQRMVFVMGCGACGSLAHHIAHEFVATLGHESKRLPVLALTAERSLLGISGSSHDEQDALVREASTFIAQGDVAVGLAHSADESDVAEALAVAVERGARTILIVGQEHGELDRLVDICVAIPSTDPARVEECHLAIGHALYQVVDEALTRPDKTTASEAVMKFNCRQCRGRIVVLARSIGKRGACPHCGMSNVVPKKDATAELEAERREHVRFKIRDAKLELYAMSGDRTQSLASEQISLVDLSIQGCTGHIQGQSLFAAGDKLLVRIHAPAFAEPIVLTGEIAACRPLADGKGQAVGVKFIFFEDDSADRLQDLASSRVRRNLGWSAAGSARAPGRKG